MTTTNALVLSAIRSHMATPADSGVGRLTRSHLRTALVMAFEGVAEGVHCRANALIAMLDRVREERLYAAQRAHAEALRSERGYVPCYLAGPVAS